MKYKIAALLVVFIAFFTVQVFAEEINLTFPEYLQLFLENSTALETAETNAENEAEAYDEAVIIQVSVFDLELLRINKEYSAKTIFTVQNEEIFSAVQHYFSYREAVTNLEFAQKNSAAAGEDYRRNNERFESDLISASALEQSELAYITSLQNLNSAENNLRGQKKQTFRPILSKWEDVNFADFVLVEPVLQLPEIDDLISSTPVIQKLEAEIAVKNAKQVQLKASTFAAPSELEHLADDLESLRSSLQNQIWSLEDALYDYAVGMAASELLLQTADLQINLALRQLETVKMQLQQGEIYPSDVTAAELPYLQALENREGVARDRYLQILELQVLMNESLLSCFE